MRVLLAANAHDCGDVLRAAIRDLYDESGAIKLFGRRSTQELHIRIEAFTVDRTEPDGRTTSSSSILYLDGTARVFQDSECSGTQSSRRVDGMTVEILRQCGAGAWTTFVRRASAKPRELVFEISEHHADGRRFDRRLVFEKQ